MAITYTQRNPADAGRFKSPHWVHVPVGSDLHLVTLTGIVLVDFKGRTPSGWRRDRLQLNLTVPDSWMPSDKWFQIVQWAPFMTINAIYNHESADHAGWAVDTFGGPGSAVIRDQLQVWADIAVRDSDGIIHRVGYNVTISGRFVDPPEGPF